jgi:tetratricopeptide (TPR) repeat protein
MQSGEVKELESAKKFTDAAYKTRRDSSNTRNNVLRAMIYSSLAYADSTRKIKSDRDHILVAKDAVAKLRRKDLERYESELNYITQNLTAAYIFKANRELADKKYEEAYQSYLEVNKLGTNTEAVIYNLAQLANQAGKLDDAIGYQKQIIENTDADAEKYLELADLYKRKKDMQSYLTTLENARTKFVDDKQILFQLIEVYAQNKSYSAIVPIVDQALQLEPENEDLVYLAGYSNENEGNIGRAKTYYQRLCELDNDNYSANLALGLIFLDEFLKDTNNMEAQYNAQNYLLRANEIKPHDVSALKGLALFYKTSGDESQLDRVNFLLNQLSNK